MTTTTTKNPILDKTIATLSRPFDVDARRVADLLCSAFEGGSNYWYMILRYELANGVEMADLRQGGKLNPPEDYLHPAELAPLVEGCSVIIEDADSGPSAFEPVKLNLDAIKRGLELFATEPYREHCNNWLDENDDAETGDVFLQLCLFGEVVFG